MNTRLLLGVALLIVTIQGWAAPVGHSDRGGNEAAMISVNIESLDFGEVEMGYAVSQTIHVTGSDLKDNINLAFDKYPGNFKVEPQTITPADAEVGKSVKITFYPTGNWPNHDNLILSSTDAQDVSIPVSASPTISDQQFINKQTVELTSFVGGIATVTGTVWFPDAEIPPGPNPPVVDRGIQFDPIDYIGPATIFPGSIIPEYYSIWIDGDDQGEFTAKITKASSIANICNVTITYIPSAVGTHQAKLHLNCSKAGVPYLYINLRGEAPSVLGDLDGNGIISITDVTDMIDLLLKGHLNNPISDMDDDGRLSITDVVTLISRILE